MAIPETPKTMKKSPNKCKQKSTNLTTVSSSSSCSQPCTPSPCSSSSSGSMIDENLENAVLIIHKWDTNGRSCTRFVSIFHENGNEVKVFIKCITGLQQAMRFLLLTDSRSEKLYLAQRLMQIAMKRLENEFHHILSENRERLEPGSVSRIFSHLSRSSISSEDERQQISLSVEQPSMIALSDLRLIADTMISCGYGKVCIEIYKIIRKSTIDEALYHLGIHPYSSSHVNKAINTHNFDDYVKNWLNAVRIAVKTLFHGEKFLCDQIFASETIRDSCLENSTKNGALNLFTFPELVATRCKRMKSERIFVLIALYDAISDLWPEIELVFSNESISSVKTQALTSLHKLGGSITMILGKFESSIRKDSSKITISGGGIHPLTDSVMNYLSSLAYYGGALSDVIADDLKFREQSPFPESYFECLNSEEISPPAVSVKLAWIILVLLCKLDGKGKLHNDAALSYLFLANNLHFIIEKVRTTNLKFILGEEWITKHERKLKKYMVSYELMSWNKVISCLPENSTVSPEKVKDCFRRLYSTFEGVYGKQTSWVVVDGKMREKMKASITNKLVPVYKEFYGKHLMLLSEDERCIKALVRFSPENMEKYLSELFQGTPAVVRSSRSYYLTLTAVSLSRRSNLIT